ncbi:DNA-binding transcriptional regulator, AcrR family [Thermomonospora echinospora]|uniref:DNA-binding transcriptional regulator, AcrR family n=1 Tax=Thermomonospora echinospora TaxID=1992 RepID=A0A1H6DUV7_9ACTN|nr:TetR/AcrR family transcriptional regulator [Thermomonospora echinospora]SEG89137.1 DNA-binding transcriptional regulator, AcrR family [Thermomonospora echinospora]
MTNSTGAGGVRQRMPYARRREQLLAAALGEFGRRGFHLTQMEHVASAAGVSKALLYQHFTSKEELFSEVTGAIVAELTDRMRTAAASTHSSVEGVRAMVRTLFDYATEEPAGWALVIRHLDKPEVGDDLRGIRDRMGEEFAGLLLRRRRANPALSPAELAANERRARLLAPLMYGSMLSMVSWWLEHPDTPRRKAENMAVEFIWLGLDRLRSGERIRFED